MFSQHFHYFFIKPLAMVNSAGKEGEVRLEIYMQEAIKHKNQIVRYKIIQN